MTARLLGAGLLVAWLSVASEVCGAAGLEVSWSPARPRPGDALWVTVKGAAADAVLEGTVAGRTARFVRGRDGHTALIGLDVDDKPGRHRWRVTARSGTRTERAQGDIEIGSREFRVQHLTLPPAMVDLDPETERRAVAEAARLTTLFRSVTTERLWRGAFTRPVEGTEPGTGFGARRVINGKPKAPHTAVDYAVPAGTPVQATGDGVVALVAEHFFPGRLVVLDHGLGVYSLYFHLDRVDVDEGARVVRGQVIASVGATGRATGPHLHFGVYAAGARIDPETLWGLPLE